MLVFWFPLYYLMLGWSPQTNLYNKSSFQKRFVGRWLSLFMKKTSRYNLPEAEAFFATIGIPVDPNGS